MASDALAQSVSDLSQHVSDLSQRLADFSHQLTSTDIAAGSLFVALVVLIATRRGRSLKTTKLKGPTSSNWIVGLFPKLLRSEDPAGVTEEWVKEFGQVFSVPVGMGRKNVTLADVKAAEHFLARDTGVYHQTGLARVFIENLFGRGILWAEEDDHRRQRKALTPAFSVGATRNYLSIFYDSAYKMKAAWEAALDSGEKTIEVQSWMNHASLDDLGIAGFGYDFGALSGTRPKVIDIFESFERPETTSWLSRILFLLGPTLPILQRLPAAHNRMMLGIRNSMAQIADGLMKEGKKEGQVDKSIMGLLVKAETASEGLTMSEEEVLAQMNTLLFAGYETTSISLTWALIELSRHQDKQQALRDELSRFQAGDPSWEELWSGLPYLDAVVQETLRLHPPLAAISRVASQDDIVPLTNPITTATGETVSHIAIAKGTSVNCPVAYINRAEELWGPDGKEFKPERWLENENGIGEGAKAIQGYHHLLTFSDGPRLCLGRNFALGNFKATLSVLIRSFAFELPEGVETKIGSHRGILPRPKLEGQNGPRVPLVVRRLD